MPLQKKFKRNTAVLQNYNKERNDELDVEYLEELDLTPVSFEKLVHREYYDIFRKCYRIINEKHLDNALPSVENISIKIYNQEELTENNRPYLACFWFENVGSFYHIYLETKN